MKNYYYSAASMRFTQSRCGMTMNAAARGQRTVCLSTKMSFVNSRARQRHGKTRVVGPDGLPAWGDIPPRLRNKCLLMRWRCERR